MFSFLKEIFKRRTVLFVCTGNTCRSPMAEGLFRKMAGKRRFVVMSAGTHAHDGYMASYNAIAVMKEKGIDISNHAAKVISRDLIDKADIVVPLSDHVTMNLLNMFPMCAEKIFSTMSVSDPFGGPIESYVKSADDIEQSIFVLIKNLKRFSR